MAVVRGAVIDSADGGPIHVASVRLDGSGRPVLTNPEGEFTVSDVPPGVHRLTVRHVAYEPTSRVVTAPAPGDTIFLAISLLARTHRLDEITVEAARVVPLTSGSDARYTLHRGVIEDLPIDNVMEIVGLLPGVVVSGDRPFFRGVGFEHVVPLIDGVPAREPLRGEWILPPPDAIHTADLVGGAFDAENGQAVGGVMSIRLPEGSPSHRGRVNYSSDRLGIISATDTHTDRVQLSVGGPLPMPGLFYAAAWQGLLSDTYLGYSHSASEHRFFDLFSLGTRMQGEQTSSIRLTFAPPEASWKAAATLLHTEQRRKHYYNHYSRTGWVGYHSEYGSYTTYVDDPSLSDSVVFNDAPPRVPTRERNSTLAIGTYTASFGPWINSQLYIRLARHAYGAERDGSDFQTEKEVRDWLWHETTRFDYQEDWFYATHGDYADYEDGASLEAAAGGNLHLRPGGGHDLAVGAGGSMGRHRLLYVMGGSTFLAGSLDDWMKSCDGFGYIQDTWWSDKLSSMKIGLRWDGQQISGYPGTGYGSTWSPRIGFHQPMTDVDALHVQAGVLYQFPPLMRHFPLNRAFAGEGIDLKAQRTRAFDVGMQHHFSEKVVAYFGSYVREYSDVVFSRRQPSEYDAIFQTAEDEPTFNVIEGYGFEAVVDHQFHPAVHGQLSLDAGRMVREDREVPWSRTLFIGGWLLARPIREVHLATSWIWNTGQPYSICLKPKGCLDEQRYEGCLPSPFEVDLEAGWSPRAGRSRIRLTAEVRNLFNRRISSFDFGIHSSRVGVGNFIAYYDETGRAGGYLVDVGSAIHRFDIDNPQTHSPGRNVRLGIEVGF